jgi:hypothetical protein
MDTLFTQAIQEHLELRARNAELECAMPLERYRSHGQPANNALATSESTAHLDHTDELDHVRRALQTAGNAAAPDSSGDLWGSPRVFDWGD